MSQSWRDYAAPIIAQVLTDTQGESEEVIKKALFDAYPFGERAMHPYKVWLSEIKKQRSGAIGMKRPASQRDREAAAHVLSMDLEEG